MRTGTRSHRLRWLRRSSAQAGRDGELLAVLLYALQGYRILGRNVRTPVAQVDLLCRRGSLLVVVEVKRRRTAQYGSALTSLHPRQAERLARALMCLRSRYGWARDARVDLVAIDGWRVRIVRNAIDGDTVLRESERLML